MTAIQSGRLRQRVTLERRSKAIGTRGQPSLEWNPLGPGRFAEVTTLSGSEVERARQLYATATHRVRIRKPSHELSTKDRCRFGKLILSIGAIVPDDEYREDIILFCQSEE